jgi:GNAT superfamily N-acetyltransferase
MDEPVSSQTLAPEPPATPIFIAGAAWCTLLSMTGFTFTIRRAEQRDLASLGQVGAHLVRMHHRFDTRRFLSPPENQEDGYAWFLGTQLMRDDVVVFVADRDGEAIGYVYAGVEPMSWMELREEAGFIYDVFVIEQARLSGVAAALIEAAATWVAERGMPRVMLWTAPQNEAARRLFTRLGFRLTMLEMTREM